MTWRAAFTVAAALSLGEPADTIIVGSAGERVVQEGESLTSISARLGIPLSTLARQNARAPNVALRAGEVIAVDSRHIAPPFAETAIVINVPQRMLFVYREGRLAAHFPIAVGKADWRTPLGDFVVREVEEEPTWDVPVSIQEEMRREGKPVLTKVPPGPANPLGRHWIGLTLPGVGIHGTNVPTSIYRFTTHGCIRMHPDDVAALFAVTRAGDTGRIVYEPVLAAVTDDGKVFLEVHPDIYRRVPDLLARARQALASLDVIDRIDAAAVKRAVRERAGVAVELPAAGRR